LGLEHDYSQTREALEDAELEEGGEGLLHAVQRDRDQPAEVRTSELAGKFRTSPACCLGLPATPL
jgi:hypothetical protein